VLATTSDQQFERFLALVENLREGGDEAVLLVGHLPPRQLQTLVDLAPRRLILVDHTGDPRVRGEYDCVAFDNVEAARLAVRHLVERGRRRIALLSGTADHYFSRDIEHGYRDMLSLLDLPFDGRLLWRGGFEPARACEVVRQELRRGTEFDAVFTTDEMAMGVYRALGESGRRVPQDVAVVGCDGLPFGEMLLPALTTVALDWRELGRAAAEHALGRGESAGPARRIRLLPRLCIRESCGDSNKSTSKDRTPSTGDKS
jgi:DNA-binding LacI/PurR family transcriptional regulator